jgi:hypothetical protein
VYQPTVEDYIPQVPPGAQDAALVLKEGELPKSPLTANVEIFL